MKTMIVLAMHGAPPNDFPREELTEFLSLHSRMEHAGEVVPAEIRSRYEELEKKIRSFPRTPKNDPFHEGSMELAEGLRQATNMDVMLGFNEFCAPNLDDALRVAVGSGAKKVIVVTPMLTRGGEHAERDIPAAIERARQRHPGIEFVCAWPFPAFEIAQFLAGRVKLF